MEQVLTQFRERIVAAAQSGTPLRLRGGGTKDWYGQAAQGELLDTRAYHGIVAYEPTELVITARCGTPLAEIEAALAQHNQMLAFEPPHFGEGATIGGAVASGLSGPRRQAVGALRDFVLGAVLMNGAGELLHFGGQVMKNVAGYDVSRLLAGSLGTLGLLTEVSLKVLPRPFAEASLQFSLTEADALRRLNEWGGQPLPISASVWQDGVLTVRLSGARAAVLAAPKKIGGELMPNAQQFWEALREQELSFFLGEGALWRVAVPTIAAPLALPGKQLIEWGGGQRWVKPDADPGDGTGPQHISGREDGKDASSILNATATAELVRAAAARAGGHATLFRGGDKLNGVFQPLAPAVAKIHRNLKTAFDPAGIFNPGRMYTGF